MWSSLFSGILSANSLIHISKWVKNELSAYSEFAVQTDVMYLPQITREPWTFIWLLLTWSSRSLKNWTEIWTPLLKKRCKCINFCYGLFWQCSSSHIHENDWNYNWQILSQRFTLDCNYLKMWNKTNILHFLIIRTYKKV